MSRRHSYMSGIDWESIGFSIFYLACAAIMTVFILTMFLDEQHKEFLNTYIGREYIYKRDSVTIIAIDKQSKNFILSNGSTVSPNLIYNLKEVK